MRVVPDGTDEVKPGNRLGNHQEQGNGADQRAAKGKPGPDRGIGDGTGQPAEQDIHQRHGDDADPAGFIPDTGRFVFGF